MNNMQRLLMATCLFGAVAFADDDTFAAIVYPGATMTHAQGINDAGDIVGPYIDAANAYHGFLYSGGKFTSIEFPGAKNTQAMGINSRGDIVGFYNDGTQHGFLLSKSKFTSLDCGAGATLIYGINSAGDMAGYFMPMGQPGQAAVWSGGGACKLSEYRPDVDRRTMTMYFGINDAGALVGHWATNGGVSVGLVYSKGTFSRVDHGSGGYVINWGINNAGDIVGTYNNATGGGHGFLLRNGHFTSIDFPGAAATVVYGTNNSGQVVGGQTDAKGTMQGFVARVTLAAPPPTIITVDDDGRQCPGSVPTIQEAVAKAPSGATILVCPGTYRGTVNITGPEKTSLKLIAVGREDEVVLQGDNTELDGFHLENVSNVLIRGFTVRDFGSTATTSTVWGTGNQINLVNAHHNIIEQNHLINGDMMGIMLMDSGNNIIQRNVANVGNSSLANCGIHVQGTKSANNVLRQNLTYGNKLAGIMIANAGPGNILMDNTVLGNGRDGITNTGTDGTWIEGNRVSYNNGPSGTSPYPPEAKGVGRGITIGTSSQVTVFDNRMRNNTGVDLNWDGNGTNKLDSNACDTAAPAGGCVK